MIDDLWDAKAWKIINLALLNNNAGNRIMTTTLSVTVASCCSSQDGYIYEMKLLSFDDSKWLFLKRAFDYENSHYPHTEDVLAYHWQSLLYLACYHISMLLMNGIGYLMLLVMDLQGILMQRQCQRYYR